MADQSDKFFMDKKERKIMLETTNYEEAHIKSLNWREHIRLRPGMYIGKLGNGQSADDGIYVLLKEVIDNCVDEFVMGAGSQIKIVMDAYQITVRDFGRGIPLEKLVDCASKINTGAKYGSEAFRKSVGLNGVGIKAVNALSSSFMICSYRDGKCKKANFSQGELTKETAPASTTEPNGTEVTFYPDPSIFKGFSFRHDYIKDMIMHYTYLNRGLIFDFNGQLYQSKNGLSDLLETKTDGTELCYPIIHLVSKDLEIAISHWDIEGERTYSYVNGQYTTMGGTHLAAFREALVKSVKEHFKRDFDALDVRQGLLGAISLRIDEPVFESQTKTKLGSSQITEGVTIRSFVLDFFRSKLDNYLHKNPKVADQLLKKLKDSERLRKELSGIKKLANERAKKAKVFNKKLRDCRIHFGMKKKEAEDTMIFITEGDSASGSLTEARDVKTQAVFSLRGKPLNCFGLTKKIVYENEEFNLLQHALNIEEDLEGLRYNKIIIATDADVDGMHIRLLLMTFFLQFFPELVEKGHVHVLRTPLYRVRDKKHTIYCYDDKEKESALEVFKKSPEITRFKGLGEISPKEFGQFIGKDMRLEKVSINDGSSCAKMLNYFMGKNTAQRQEFIISNLRNL